MVSGEKIILESVSTSKKVSFLKDPDSYPEHPKEIRVLETHMSLLFLTEDHVYKLKKPVRFDSVDFTTPGARHFNCLEELRLNQELAKEVYLAVWSLNCDKSGNLSLNGPGRAVDWLVKMKRLREENLLHNALLNKNVDKRHLEKAAEKLAQFYNSRTPVDMDPGFFIVRLKKRIQKNHEALSDPVFGLSKNLLKEILEKQLTFLQKKSPMFAKRIQAGKVVEAHGDLKPEHIWLDENPMIIDRLEFDENLRIQEITEEVSLLAIECELLDNPEVGEFFFTVYQKLTKDKIPQQLKYFYKSKQAALRAKFAIWHLREARYREDPKWRKRTDACLQLSLHYSTLLK